MEAGKYWRQGLLAALLLSLPLPGSARSGTTGPASEQAPAKAPTVLVEPHYKVGDKVRLRIEKTSRGEMKGQVVARQHTGFDVRMKVLESGPRAIRIECIYGRTEVLKGTDQSIRDNPVMKAVIDSNEGLRVLLVAGPRMSQPHVENIDEVLTRFRQTLEKAGDKMEPEVRDGVMKLAGQLMTNREAFAARLIQELLVYFGPVGVQVPLEGALSGSQKVASLTGGEPVSTWSSLSIENYDRAAGRLKLKYRQSSNPDDVRAQVGSVVGSVVQDQAARSSGKAPDDATAAAAAAKRKEDADKALAGLRINDVASYEVDMITGWPVSARHVHTVTTGDQRMTDETVVRRVMP